MQDSSMNEICHNVGGVYKQTIEGTNQVLDMNELEKQWIILIKQTSLTCLR